MTEQIHELEFVNIDATPKITTLSVAHGNISPIMDWYGSFHVGDRYCVTVDGKLVAMDHNGGLVTT